MVYLPFRQSLYPNGPHIRHLKGKVKKDNYLRIWNTVGLYIDSIECWVSNKKNHYKIALNYLINLF